MYTHHTNICRCITYTPINTLGNRIGPEVRWVVQHYKVCSFTSFSILHNYIRRCLLRLFIVLFYSGFYRRTTFGCYNFKWLIHMKFKDNACVLLVSVRCLKWNCGGHISIVKQCYFLISSDCVMWIIDCRRIACQAIWFHLIQYIICIKIQVIGFDALITSVLKSCLDKKGIP